MRNKRYIDIRQMFRSRTICSYLECAVRTPDRVSWDIFKAEGRPTRARNGARPQRARSRRPFCQGLQRRRRGRAGCSRRVRAAKRSSHLPRRRATAAAPPETATTASRLAAEVAVAVADTVAVEAAVAIAADAAVAADIAVNF